MSRRMKWFVGIVSVTLCCFACTFLCLLPFCLDKIAHNVRLSEYEKAFLEIHPPENTSSVAFLKKVGLIAGGGNHCDYLVGDLRQYSGTSKDIETFYNGKAIYDQKFDLPFGLPVDVLFLADGQLPGPSDWLEEADYSRKWVLYELSNWSVDLEGVEGDLYFVYVLDAANAPGLDWRCR